MHPIDVVPDDSPEFTLQRVFDAPRHRIYEIWTQPRYVQQWWGVDGSTIVRCELDVRPGGSFRIDMMTPDGTVYVNRGVYLEVIENERIVSRDLRDTADSTAEIPGGTHTVIFSDLNAQTLVTLTSRFASIEERDLMVRYGMLDGISQSLARLNTLSSTTA